MRNEINFNYNKDAKGNRKSIQQIYYEIHLIGLKLKAEIKKQESQYDNPMKGLAVFDNDIEGLINSKEQNVDDDELNKLYKEIESFEEMARKRVIQYKKEGSFLALEHIADIFRLTNLEKNVLALCLAPELDSKYEKLYAYLQDDITKKRPTFELIMKINCFDNEERIYWISEFFTNSNLIKYGIVKLLENIEGTLISNPLQLDSRILEFIIGNDLIDRKLKNYAKLLIPDRIIPSIVNVNGKISDLEGSIQNILKKVSECNKKVVVNLYGPEGSGKKDAALCLGKKIGKNLIEANISLNEKNAEYLSLISAISKESVLLSAIPVFYSMDDSNDEKFNAVFLDTVINSLYDCIPIVFIVGEKPIRYKELSKDAVLVSKEFGIPEEAERKKIWINESSSYPFNNCIDFGGLAGKFRFTQGQIRNALEGALYIGLLRQDFSRIEESDIYKSCRLLSENKLNELAVRVDVRHTWKDIVLPKDQMSQLKEICNQVKNRHVVHGDWGFGRKLPYGKGLNAMFSGPSGTGKTMAAQIIAGELGMELYRIDLSQVISKYIGETEKNLDKLFKEADTGNAILFFDEADSLFGKRSDVKDSHDRYANIETGYLLQKIEEYSGISILATNLKDNMDNAFSRRLNFSIEFPFPDFEMRKGIWEIAFPEETPLGNDIDFGEIAGKIDLAGGNIKNIALNAAFYAANDNRSVELQHVWKAAHAEYRKVGRTWK